MDETPYGHGRVSRVARWYRRHVLAATVVLIAAVLVAGFVSLQLAMWGRVGDGVTVAGVSLQGQTMDAAAASLEHVVAPRLSPVRLDAGTAAPLTLGLGQLGLRLDSRETAAAALARGRHRLPLGLQVWLPGGGGEVPAELAVDPGVFRRGLEVVRAAVDVAPTEARLALRGGRLEVVPSQDGRTVDAIALKQAIATAAAMGKAYAGPVPLKAVPPQVSTAVARERAAAAGVYLERPLILRYRGRGVTLSPKRMAGMLSVTSGPDADEYPLTFHNGHARAELHRLFAWAETKPVAARIIVHAEGGITVTRSKDGDVLDMDVLLDDLDDAARGGGLRSVVVALKPARPALTTADVETSGLASVGTQFVTFFDPRNTTRVRNIALAAKLADGSVVAPGRVFSLNAALGPRTTNRGFDYAPVIASDNVLRQGVGGGICQYATTLFNAVFFAGLPVVERRPHALYISHYPIGRDATVSWGSVDFKFLNDTPRALTIRSWVEDDHLTVALVGKTGREVTYATGSFYDVRRPAHGRSDPRVVYDDDLGPGVVRWERGVDGHSVRVERTVRNADGRLLFRDAFVSHYLPMDWIKRVGT